MHLNCIWCDTAIEIQKNEDLNSWPPKYKLCCQETIRRSKQEKQEKKELKSNKDVEKNLWIRIIHLFKGKNSSV